MTDTPQPEYCDCPGPHDGSCHARRIAKLEATIAFAATHAKETDALLAELEAEVAARDRLLRSMFFGIINCNDLFEWACADQVGLDEGLFDVAVEAIKRFGYSGLDAVVCRVRGQDPQKPVTDRNPEYWEAKKWVNAQPWPDYVDESELADAAKLACRVKDLTSQLAAHREAVRKAIDQFEYMAEYMREHGPFYHNADGEVASRLEELRAAFGGNT